MLFNKFVRYTALFELLWTEHKKSADQIRLYWILRSSTTLSPNNGIKPTPIYSVSVKLYSMGTIKKWKFQNPKISYKRFLSLHVLLSVI